LLRLLLLPLLQLCLLLPLLLLCLLLPLLLQLLQLLQLLGCHRDDLLLGHRLHPST
jgi:hypothetical protein